MKHEPNAKLKNVQPPESNVMIAQLWSGLRSPNFPRPATGPLVVNQGAWPRVAPCGSFGWQMEGGLHLLNSSGRGPLTRSRDAKTVCFPKAGIRAMRAILLLGLGSVIFYSIRPAGAIPSGYHRTRSFTIIHTGSKVLLHGCMNLASCHMKAIN